MIKGCKKRMVIVSGLNDSSIEAAYFVMRDSDEAGSLSDDDIIKKANSIIEDNSADTLRFGVSNRKNRDLSERIKEKKVLAPFLTGFFTGTSLIGVICLLVGIIK